MGFSLVGWLLIGSVVLNFGMLVYVFGIRWEIESREEVNKLLMTDLEETREELEATCERLLQLKNDILTAIHHPCSLKSSIFNQKLE